MPTDAGTPPSDAALAGRRSIQKLAPLLVNQIAAGEVIERPASVVKELVENSIDAGSTRISIDLERGGIELIRIADDGCGIPPEELPLALAPHATSKIRQADDLDRIATKGFRGEALASIASIARMSILSRPHDADEAFVIEASGDEQGEPRPASRPPGTTIEARNLFFNTPARRKFLRTPQTEQTRCMEWIRNLAMAHPRIAFTVTSDGRKVLDLAPDQSPRTRVLEIIGRELDSQLIEVGIDEFDDARGIALWGLVGLPTIARATARAQHVFLSGRAIKDKTIQHALREAYRGLIEPGRHPTAVLMIEMSPEGVDVNVHPAKLEVRFRDQSMVHQAVLHAVRDALRAHDLTPSAAERSPGLGNAGGAGSETAILAPHERGAAHAPASIEPKRFAEVFTRDIPASTGGHLSYDAIRGAVDARAEEGGTHPTSATGSSPVAQPAPPVAPAAPHAEPVAIRKASKVLQIHRSYLVTEDESGIVLIDQHALHERVMFEKLLARVTSPEGEPIALETQRLLTPAVVPAAPAAVELLDALRPLLERLGIDADPLGPASVAVHSFPSLLFSRNVDPVDFMGDLLERVEREGLPGMGKGEPGIADSEAALHEVLDMMACKAAIKAGDALSDDELSELIALRERVERSGSCPHGRATTVRLTIEELEKLFDRR
ncbi:MAG: DNA mismatch repair endonuclease MutL [Phycisphaerales bacterium JB059]